MKIFSVKLISVGFQSYTEYSLKIFGEMFENWANFAKTFYKSYFLNELMNLAHKLVFALFLLVGNHAN